MNEPLDQSLPAGVRISPLRRLYISGPMTGYRDYNAPAFHRAKNVLQEYGYEVASPADTLQTMPGASIDAIMKKDCADVCDADALVLLDGWKASRGCTIEVLLAEYLKIPCIPFDLFTRFQPLTIENAGRLLVHLYERAPWFAQVAIEDAFVAPKLALYAGTIPISAPFSFPNPTWMGYPLHHRYVDTKNNK